MDIVSQEEMIPFYAAGLRQYRSDLVDRRSRPTNHSEHLREFHANVEIIGHSRDRHADVGSYEGSKTGEDLAGVFLNGSLEEWFNLSLFRRSQIVVDAVVEMIQKKYPFPDGTVEKLGLKPESVSQDSMGHHPT